LSASAPLPRSRLFSSHHLPGLLSALLHYAPAKISPAVVIRRPPQPHLAPCPPTPCIPRRIPRPRALLLLRVLLRILLLRPLPISASSLPHAAARAPIPFNVPSSPALFTRLARLRSPGPLAQCLDPPPHAAPPSACHCRDERSGRRRGLGRLSGAAAAAVAPPATTTATLLSFRLVATPNGRGNLCSSS
jgi:hypothetical protein